MNLISLKEFKYVPKEHSVLGTKWVSTNKLDETKNAISNMTILVAKRYNQEEDIDFNETFAPNAQLEAICILLTFESYMNTKLYQMDVNCVFLNRYL